MAQQLYNEKKKFYYIIHLLVMERIDTIAIYLD